MTIIKVTHGLFSTIKTIDKAIKKCKHHDVIHVAPALYKETLQFTTTTTVIGQNKDECVIHGAIIIPKNVTVSFKDITIMPTAHIHIEGTAHFENVYFNGSYTNVIMSLASSKVTLKHCQLKHANDIAIAAFKNSNINLQHCIFSNNGKTHLLLDNSNAKIQQCSIEKGMHALWLKNESNAQCKNNTIHHQRGTQIIVQQSSYFDENSIVEYGEGNGLFASRNSSIDLKGCTYNQHLLPQLWIEESELVCTNTTIENGDESGIMIRQHSSCKLEKCHISSHKISNIQLYSQSQLSLKHSSIEKCEGIGIQIRDQSIANIEDTLISQSTLTQVFITDKSIVSMKKTKIVDGSQVGIIVEKRAQCTILQCNIYNHLNSGITVLQSELTAIQCSIEHNDGNGILTANDSVATIEDCNFSSNKMPYIGGKKGSTISVSQSELVNGKSVFILDDCSVFFEDCQFKYSEGVQIELNDRSSGTFIRCTIQYGKTNAIKLLRDSNANLVECLISHHVLPQIVANDSSFVIKNSEVTDGERNGFIIENHAEALIEETYISRHKYPQIWVDLNSNVELSSVQLTEGVESDLYLQNESTLVAFNSFIKNLTFTYNIQSINNSKIELHNTIIEHFSGNCFYTENNSEIIANTDDSTDHEKK